MSARKNNRRDLWEREDFEDIKSHSSGDPPQYDWMVNRAKPSAESPAPRPNRPRSTGTRPSRDRNGRTSARPGRGAQNRNARSPANPQRKSGRSRPQPSRGAPPRERREQPPRKRRKPVSKTKRRILVVLLALGMLLGMGFLAESLLFRVTEIQVAGDPIYAEEDVLRLCGIETGDNLLLLSTSRQARELMAQLPYAADVSITRKLPGTVVIEITAARGVCCMESGGAWYVLDSVGKVLEARNSPQEGLLQVIGLNPDGIQVGQTLALEDDAAGAAFLEIARTIDGLGAAEQFTRLDLRDLYDIRLLYQNRVEFVLGNTSQLAYKVQYGHGHLTDPNGGVGPDETGVLDLTYLPRRKWAFFDPDAAVNGLGQGQQPSATPNTPAATPDGTGEPNVPYGTTEPDATPEPDPEEDSSQDRGGDIPDQLYGET